MKQLHLKLKSVTESQISKIIPLLRFPVSLCLILISLVLLNDQSWCAKPPAKDPSDFLLPLPEGAYVHREKARGKTGVTIYNKDKVFPGYNIFTSDDSPDVFVNLIDMDGKIVHRWTMKKKDPLLRWKDVTPFPNGSLLLTGEFSSPDWQWIDIASRSTATLDMPGYKAHHTSYCLKEGGFLSLVANIITVSVEGLPFRIRDNSLVHVSAGKEIIKTISLNKLLEKDSSYQKKLKEAHQAFKDYWTRPNDAIDEPIFDLFHADHIESLEWDIPGIAKKGDWLVTIRTLSRVIIVNPETEKIVWEWGKNAISFPNHATFLDGDKIMIFDNGFNKKASRVIILSLGSKKILWQYGQKSGLNFFTRILGSAQRLPNGNILIAESDRGRAFEVTSSGEIVWEWYADLYPKGKFKGKRMIIYRMIRLPYDFFKGDFFKGVTFNYGKI